MGRTNPTYRRWFERFQDEWQPFRRALRRAHQEDFDRLFDRASEHASAAGFQNPTDPTTAVIISIMLAQERELRALREQLESDNDS